MDLRSMTQPEFENFLVRNVREYAADKVRAGTYAEEGAEQRARAEFDRLLPAGLASPGQLLYTAVDEGVAVGILWLALPAEGRPQGWVYEIRVDEAHRGKGYGRAIMLAAQRELAARGIYELGLHVFGHNPVAIKLYESLGYSVTGQTMAKTFAPTD